MSDRGQESEGGDGQDRGGRSRDRGGRSRYPPAPPAQSRRLTPRTPAQQPPAAERPASQPSYRRYRAGPGRRGASNGLGPPHSPADGDGAARRGRGGPRVRQLPRITPKRLLLGLLALLAGWLLLSLALFLISSHFERVSPPADVTNALEPDGFPITSASDILVLGSDKREKGSREPGAEISGPGRSDTIMLIRTGGGHSARLSIPRDTVTEIPGYGMQKINAAHAFGGPKLSIEVIKRFLGVPINHVVEVNFENFPALIDAMGGVTYTGGCIDSEISGGVQNGGYTLKLSAGAHHLDGREALILARTRHNLCVPAENDLNREEHQQALFNDMRSQLSTLTAFVRLPLIAWNAPPAIISDMSGPELLGLFASLTVDGSAPTKVLRPTGAITLPDGEQGLTISEAAKRRQVAEFMSR
jgi:LCP family protein required for cell wall assembly